MLRDHIGPVIYETSADGDKMDPECVALCDAMNEMEGIETIASCCGHSYAPFRIYFEADSINDLKPILTLIDESEDWRMRVSFATGGGDVYFILDGPTGQQGFDVATALASRAVRLSPKEEGARG
jgi:hypothetical protein